MFHPGDRVKGPHGEGVVERVGLPLDGLCPVLVSYHDVGFAWHEHKNLSHIPFLEPEFSLEEIEGFTQPQ